MGDGGVSRAAECGAAGPVVATQIYRTRVEWMDTDAGGHHHNTSVNRFVESAEAALVREHGLDGYFGNAPRVHYEADFASPLWFGQEVTVTLVLERVGTTSMTFRFEVWGEPDGEHPRVLAASGRYVTVHVPPGSPRGARRAAPWPEEWRKRLATQPTD